MNSRSPSPTEIEALAKSFRGQVLTAKDADYEAARHVHNGSIDKRPAVIARCAGTSDIVQAVNFGREQGLEIAVRGGGHNVAGLATVDGGLLIDLSPMKGIFVDARMHIARAQGGCTWADFNRETQLHGLATTGGVVSSTGIAGLTLGGGLGWLMPKYGMALDNLLSAEVVTADGQVLRASASEHEDLFWALRGGGGNFGVVSSFEFALHPVGPTILGGLTAHPFEKAHEVLRFYREQSARMPDEVMTFCGLMYAPDGSGAKLVGVLAAHCGDPAAAAEVLQPFKDFGPPILDAIGPITYSALNGMLDDAFPRGALNYWKSSFLETLTDQAIDTIIDCFAACPAPMSKLLLEHFHGAVCRVAADATAFQHRGESYNLAVLGQWQDPKEGASCTAWTRETMKALEPYLAPRRYVNYMGDDEGAGGIASAFGPNLARLRKVKAQYDPANLFRRNQNILPA